MTYRPIAHIIGDIVAEVAKTTEVYYDYGSQNEIANRLREKTDSADYYDKKYPLIWFLIQDQVKEKVDNSKALKRKAEGLTIIICSETKQEFTSKERYDHLFIPILRPLYEAFMYQLELSKAVKSDTKFSHEYYENLFWGKNGLYGHEGNILNDKIDSIIIDELDLLIIETC